MSEESCYCWVVVCKNRWFHLRRNFFAGHRIPLGETDVAVSLAPIQERFAVRCDECGKEYLYRPTDVRSHEQQLPESFTPHPLFQLGEERRRSRRSPKEVRIIVRGESAGEGGFEEKTFARSVSAHGALLLLARSVRIGETLFVKDPRTQKEVEGRVVRSGVSEKGFPLVAVEFAQPAPRFWRAESQVA